MLTPSTVASSLPPIAGTQATAEKDQVREEYKLLMLTFKAIENTPTESCPATLQEACAVVLLKACNRDRPIMTLAQARNVMAQEHVIAMANISKNTLVPGGTTPRLFADYMAHNKIPFEAELAGATAELLAKLPKPERLPLLDSAVKAGMSMASLESILALGTHFHPEIWRLEEVAANSAAMARNIEAGKSLDQLDEIFGPFYTPVALSRLNNVFLTSRAKPQVYSGRSCDAVQKEWDTDMLAAASDLRFLVFRNDPAGLQAYEARFGIPAEPVRQEHVIEESDVYSKAVIDAQSGAPIKQLLEHPLMEQDLRDALEQTSCLGVAGRKVFSGEITCSQAEKDYDIQLPVSRTQLQVTAEAGLLIRSLHRSLAKLRPDQMVERQRLALDYRTSLHRILDRAEAQHRDQH